MATQLSTATGLSVGGITSQCHDCGSWFPSRSQLTRHHCRVQKRLGNNEEEGFACRYCNLVFSHSGMYFAHMRPCPALAAQAPHAQHQIPVPRGPTPPPVTGSFATPLKEWVAAKVEASEAEVEKRVKKVKKKLEEEYVEKTKLQADVYDDGIKKMSSKLRLLSSQLLDDEERHAKEIVKTNEGHAEELAKVKEYHRQEITAVKKNHGSAMKKASENHVQELELMETEIQRLEAALEAASKVKGCVSNIPQQMDLPISPSCSPPARGYCPLDSPDEGTVTIFVGSRKEQEQFVLKRKHLAAVSSVFESSLPQVDETPDLPGQFEVETTATMEIYDFSPEIFRIFNEWLSSRGLVDRQGNSYDSPKNVSPYRHTDLLSIYIFAHVYDVPQLRRDALEAYMRLCTELSIFPSAAEISVAYDALPTDSPLIRFVLDLFVYIWGGIIPDAEMEEWNALPVEFFRDLAQSCARSRQPQGHWFQMCSYHEHGGSE